MIDKVTFVIILIKMLGIQVIIIGVFFAVMTGRPVFEILVCLGSLIFAIGSNILLAVNIKRSKEYKIQEGYHHERRP